MYVATERETSDNTEATRFSQCAHDQRRRLEAEDCNSIRCAQLISGGRRRIRPCPPHCLAHARSTMCCIRLVISWLIGKAGKEIRGARRAKARLCRAPRRAMRARLQAYTYYYAIFNYCKRRSCIRSKYSRQSAVIY